MKFLVLVLCLGVAAAQSMGPSNTLHRRDPLPTDRDELLMMVDQTPRSRTRSRIVGRGHEADELPLNNAERMRLGLPFKPPTRHNPAPKGHDAEEEIELDLDLSL